MSLRRGRYAPRDPATRDDVGHMVGELDEIVIAESLAAQPSYGDWSEATILARGDA